MKSDTTEWFVITAGVRQGCLWSPLIFLILIDYVLKHDLDNNNLCMVIEKKKRLKIPIQMLSDLALADNIALLDDTVYLLQKAANEVAERGSKAGLIISAKKTKVMTIDQHPNDIVIKIQQCTPLENVKSFTY